MDREERIKNAVNMKPKTNWKGNKSVNFSMLPKTEEVAFVESALVSKEEVKVITEEDIKDAVVYSNDMTSIDFMMPEEEREIIEKNLNTYENIEAMQKILATAKRNKKISEDIKTLELISKAGDLSNELFDVMTDSKSIEMLKKAFREKVAQGEVAKAYKELATANKIMLDAREEMNKRLNPGNSKKNARIALKFTNDNGEDFQLGVEV